MDDDLGVARLEPPLVQWAVERERLVLAALAADVEAEAAVQRLKVRPQRAERFSQVALVQPQARHLHEHGVDARRHHLGQELRLVALPQVRVRRQAEPAAHVLDAAALVVGEDRAGAHRRHRRVRRLHVGEERVQVLDLVARRHRRVPQFLVDGGARDLAPVQRQRHRLGDPRDVGVADGLVHE